MNKFFVWYGTLASMLYDIIHEQQVYLAVTKLISVLIQNEEFKFSYFEFSKNFALTAKDFGIFLPLLLTNISFLYITCKRLSSI